MDSFKKVVREMKSTNIRTRAITVMIFIVLGMAIMASCTKATKLPDDKNPQSQIDSLASCDKFPHPTEFKRGQHGKCFSAQKNSCKACHGQDLGGGSSKMSCTGCHKMFDHDEEFISSKHGEEYLKDNSACASCHEVGNLHVNSKPICWSCHNYPHPKTWSLPNNHGKKLLSELASNDILLNCKDCHAKDSSFKERFPEKFVGCDVCHIEIPHPIDFTEYGDHAAIARTYAGGCTNCHKNMNTLMPRYQSCQYCHDDDITTMATTKWVNEKEYEKYLTGKQNKINWKEKRRYKKDQRDPASKMGKTLFEKINAKKSALKSSKLK